MTGTEGRPDMPTENSNILLIPADDVGWLDVGAYHRGLMGTRTPIIDRIVAEGAMMTDAWTVLPAAALVQHAATREDFPPRQPPPDFNPQQMLEHVLHAAAAR
jgi:hypothetical protein